MTATVGFFVPGQSWLYRLDPRAKLWLSVLGIGLCLVTTRIDLLAAALVIAHLVLILGGLPLGKLALVWRRVLVLLIVILVLQPIISPGPEQPIAQIGPVRITQSGLLLGLHYALRVAAAAFFALIPIMTTPINLLVRGLQKLGLPYVWGTAIGLALRYLGTIGELYTTIAEAQAARGWDPATGSPIRRARAAVPALVALVIASLRLSDSLSLGMAARGFGLNRARTWREDIAMAGADWLVIALSGAAFAAMLALVTV